MVGEVRRRRRPAPPAADRASDDDAVGYKKPPRHTRFQPGQSGNPKGRPKGAKNLRTELAEELQECITLREGGERRSVSKQRALLKRLMEKALQGDVRAASLIINMVARFLDQAEPEDDATPLAETDVAILEAYQARLTERTNHERKSMK
jgi:hypothetical protein